MKREVAVFVVVYIVVAVLSGVAAAALPEKAAQYAGLILLPLLIVPFIMAYVCNRMAGAAGGPFRGLTWGGGGIATAYFIGLGGGLATLLAAVGLGLMGIDFGMSDYIDMIKASSPQEMPAGSEKFLSIGGWVTLIGGPTIGAFFGAFVACLATLPFYGWLGRRLLASGRPAMIGGLALLTLATGWVQAMAPNPMTTDIPRYFLALSAALAGAASVIVGSWFFLRYRSAFVPALFGASYNGVMAAGMVVSSDANLLFAPPTGLATMLGALVIGVALWVMKDPGGAELAIAAVAPDGTPLTPQQLAALQTGSSSSVPAEVETSSPIQG